MFLNDGESGMIVFLKIIVIMGFYSFFSWFSLYSCTFGKFVCACVDCDNWFSLSDSPFFGIPLNISWMDFSIFYAEYIDNFLTTFKINTVQS